MPLSSARARPAKTEGDAVTSTASPRGAPTTARRRAAGRSRPRTSESVLEADERGERVAQTVVVEPHEHVGVHEQVAADVEAQAHGRARLVEGPRLELDVGERRLLIERVEGRGDDAR